MSWDALLGIGTKVGLDLIHEVEEVGVIACRLNLNFLFQLSVGVSFGISFSIGIFNRAGIGFSAGIGIRVGWRVFHFDILLLDPLGLDGLLHVWGLHVGVGRVADGLVRKNDV